METMIAQLLTQFENGTLTRRQLIQGLAAAALAAGGVTAAAQGGGFRTINLDHLSYDVTDYTAHARLLCRPHGYDRSPTTTARTRASCISATRAALAYGSDDDEHQDQAGRACRSPRVQSRQLGHRSRQGRTRATRPEGSARSRTARSTRRTTSA